MKNIFVFVALTLFFQACEIDNIEPQVDQQVTEPQANQQEDQTQSSFSSKTAAYTFYVSPTGSDAANGSSANPWKTLKHAVTQTPANQDYAIQLSAGTFIENGRIDVPPGVSIYGAGIDNTLIKAVSSFYYYPASPSYATDKFLISLNSSSQENGNQTLSGFTIDGDSKKLHGGVYVHYRNNVIIDAIKVKNTNFTGIWLWDVKDAKLLNSKIINSSWGSTSYCVGALNIGNLERVEIANLDVDEDRGYGIKAIGPGGNNNILNLKIRDSRISVHPYGLWNNGSAPNIAIELWSVNLVKSEIYNTYVDNTISLINSNALPSTGVQSIRVHHNTIDMETRAQGKGYGVELTVHDAEIDHNYFLKGSYGIANWDHAMQNWNIHHNTFYALQGNYPGEALRSQSKGLHNVKFYNNTIEFAGTRTMNVIGLYGGVSNNIDVKNNLFIDNNTSYSYYPNQFIHMENGATLSTLTVKNNSFHRLPIGNVPGSYSNNLTADPLINKSGNRPNPYYMPKAGSPLINTGFNVGYPFTDSAPEIGAFEYGATTQPPVTSTPTTPETPATPDTPTTPDEPVTVILDSYTAILRGNMRMGSDAEAGGVTYFHIPPGNGKNYVIPPPADATFNIQLPKSDNYVVWARVKSSTSANQTSYVYNGRGKWYVWPAGIHTTWTWVKINEGGSIALFPFVQGSNQLKIAWNDEDVKVDQVIITNDLTLVP